MELTRNYQGIINSLQAQPSLLAPASFSWIASYIRDVQQVLFETPASQEELQTLLERIEERTTFFLHTYSFHTNPSAPSPETVSSTLLSSLPLIKGMLMQDAQYTYKGDPSATSPGEICLAYPGIFATSIYRIAHHFHTEGYPTAARILSEYAHRQTGIDIHPGAVIGHSFFIDHGTGIVIGETCIIGNRVSIYHGVTLGVYMFELDEEGNAVRGTKRHPTIENDVSLYAKSTVLGGHTVIGKGSLIGSNVTVTKSIPPHSKVFRSL